MSRHNLIPGSYENKGRSHVALFHQLAILLSDSILTRDEVREKLGICEESTTRWFKQLSSGYPNNCIYIAGWRQIETNHNWVALWKWGIGGKDVPKPKKTSTQHSRAYRLRKEIAAEDKLMEKGRKERRWNRDKPKTAQVPVNSIFALGEL